VRDGFHVTEIPPSLDAFDDAFASEASEAAVVA
jgi:hypothetical protein